MSVVCSLAHHYIQPPPAPLRPQPVSIRSTSQVSWYALALKGIPFQEVMVDLNNKSQWHHDLNGGMVPVLETPAGDLIIESGVIMAFAQEYAPEIGVNLIPKDPIAAAKMRVAMAKFDSTMSSVWDVFGTRYEDVDKIKACRENSLAKWEALAQVASDKWLQGTEEPTMLDVYCGAMWDSVYTRAINESAHKTFHDAFQAKTVAPHWCAYMEKFRAHPAIHKYRFRNLAVEKHGLRMKDWPQGQKVALSLAVLEDVFEAEE